MEVLWGEGCGGGGGWGEIAQEVLLKYMMIKLLETHIILGASCKFKIILTVALAFSNISVTCFHQRISMLGISVCQTCNKTLPCESL